MGRTAAGATARATDIAASASSSTDGPDRRCSCYCQCCSLCCSTSSRYTDDSASSTNDPHCPSCCSPSIAARCSGMALAAVQCCYCHTACSRLYCAATAIQRASGCIVLLLPYSAPGCRVLLLPYSAPGCSVLLRLVAAHGWRTRPPEHAAAAAAVTASATACAATPCSDTWMEDSASSTRCCGCSCYCQCYSLHCYAL